MRRSTPKGSSPARLVVAQHPVAAVVDDHRRQRDLLLRHRRQLPAGEQEAAVAADRHRRAGAGERSAERGREGEAERPPADRVVQLARVVEPVEAADPVARDAHVADHVARRRAARTRPRRGSAAPARRARGTPGADLGRRSARGDAVALPDALDVERGRRRLDAVVPARVSGSTLTEPRRLRLQPVLRVHPVEVAADATTRSASSQSAPAGPRCGGIPTSQGARAGAPRAPPYVVTTGAPSRSASARDLVAAVAGTAAGPDQRPLRRREHASLCRGRDVARRSGAPAGRRGRSPRRRGGRSATSR